jgi:hypothetical protein
MVFHSHLSRLGCWPLKKNLYYQGSKWLYNLNSMMQIHNTFYIPCNRKVTKVGFLLSENIRVQKDYIYEQNISKLLVCYQNKKFKSSMLGGGTELCVVVAKTSRWQTKRKFSSQDSINHSQLPWLTWIVYWFCEVKGLQAFSTCYLECTPS